MGVSGSRRVIGCGGSAASQGKERVFKKVISRKGCYAIKRSAVARESLITVAVREQIVSRAPRSHRRIFFGFFFFILFSVY